MRAVDALIGKLRSELRLLPRVRMSKIKAVDDSGVFDRVTVDTGQRMVTLTAVAVDDTVIWLSGPLPVCVGKPYSSP